jgi:hypothetical protein
VWDQQIDNRQELICIFFGNFQQDTLKETFTLTVWAPASMMARRKAPAQGNEMQLNSLSHLPLEILPNIFCYLGKDSKTLSRLLRVSKTLGSRAVTFLYRDFRAVPKDSDRFPQLLKTLYLSLRGSSYYCYHRCIDKLSTKGWLMANDLFGAKTLGRLLELFDVVSQSGKLKDLSLSVDRFLEELEHELKVDWSALTSLTLSIPAYPEASTRTWLQTMVPRMPLKNLTMSIHHWNESKHAFPVQNASVKSLKVRGGSVKKHLKLGTKFWQTFFAPNCKTLTTLRLQDVKLTMNSNMELPNLQSLVILHCSLEGWDKLCRSLTSLTHLQLCDVQLSGVHTEEILSFFPPDSIRSLVTLRIGCVSKSNRLPSPWLNAFATSLLSLRSLSVDAISVDALENVLRNCPKLKEYSHLPFEYRRGTGATNEHLQVISQFAPASLKVLALRLGQFSTRDLTAFAASFPVSVTFLDLCGSHSLSTGSLRALFRLPLRDLFLQGMSVPPEYQSEVEHVLQTERPVRLRKFVWNFDYYLLSYSTWAVRRKEDARTLRYNSWDI